MYCGLNVDQMLTNEIVVISGSNMQRCIGEILSLEVLVLTLSEHYSYSVKLAVFAGLPNV